MGLQLISDNSPGQTASIKDIKGTITVPEVAHDTEEDEYVVRSLLLHGRPPFFFFFFFFEFG